jgi:two-component system nitrogen regulation response regulator GlnG
MGIPAKILVVDDEEAICFAFQRYFEPRGYRVHVASTGSAGFAAYAEEPAEVVFVDVRLPDTDGIDLLARLCDHDPHARVVVITAHGSLETVTRAIRGRAFDYLVKPIDLDRAAELVVQALASRQAASGDAASLAALVRRDDATLVGRSPAIQEVYKRIGRVAESDAAVLIVGDTGTGKELVARAIHEHSRRRAGPFVAVNCGALPENLVESELFGYARGAFTGAAADKPGRFEAAAGGTLFFDEVGELPPAAQVKLLRFLDTQTVERLGSVQPIRLDVRILAATNCDLAGAMAAGRFRQDLYYRLAVIQIVLPPLAARTEDILPLVHHFLAQRTPAGQKPPILTREAAAMLEACPWPGNVRELRNAVEHAAVASGGGPILPAHLPEAVRQGAARPSAEAPSDLDALLEQFLAGLPAGSPLGDVVPRLEKALIRRALAEAGGNQSLAAERLGLHRNTLRNKLRDLGLGA